MMVIETEVRLQDLWADSPGLLCVFGSLPFSLVLQFPVCHKYFLKFILVGDLSTHMYVHRRCVPCLQKPEDGVRLSGRGITDGCELPGECWGFNTGLLQEQ